MMAILSKTKTDLISVRGGFYDINFPKRYYSLAPSLQFQSLSLFLSVFPKT